MQDNSNPACILLTKKRNRHEWVLPVTWMSKDSPEWFLSWSLAYLYPAKSEIFTRKEF